MKELIKQIEIIRSKLDGWRRLSMKEAQTRATIIDPLLEALGWDVRDPDEVELEYATVDGKAVDYGLKINRKPVLLIEAKPLNDPLDDVKAITQVVGYAANAGITSCILTNGEKWRVYRSMEKCEARDKLMFEVSLDPRESEGLSAQQLAEQMWRFSRDEMAKGTLDKLGEQTFTDSKVRKAMDDIMRDPPNPIVRLVSKTLNDETVTTGRIKESLRRIWRRAAGEQHHKAVPAEETTMQQESPGTRRKSRFSRKEAKKKGEYDESIHTAGKPKYIVELYRAINDFCLSLNGGQVEKQERKDHIGYRKNRTYFCKVALQRSSLRVFLKLKHGRLKQPPGFAREATYARARHWGSPSLSTELAISSLSEVEQAKELIRQAFDSTK